MADDLLERFPIGSRWLDTWGDLQHVIGQGSNGELRTVEIVKDDDEPYGERAVINVWPAARLDGWKPYVEPQDGFEYGVVESDGSFYGFYVSCGDAETALAEVRETFPGGRVFKFGIRDGELFIEWVTNK